MMINLFDALDHAYASLNYDSQNRWLTCTWLGEQNSISVLLGSDACLSLLQKHACCCLLNDNRQMSGYWSSEIVDRLIDNWAPQAIQAGLTHLATVVYPDSLAAIYEEAMRLDLAGRLHMRAFHQLSTAQQWLLASQAPR